MAALCLAQDPTQDNTVHSVVMLLQLPCWGGFSAFLVCGDLDDFEEFWSSIS